MSNQESPGIRKELEELAEVSRDLDRHQKLSQSASHPIQAQQVRKRLDELTARQATLMEELVSRHPNGQTKAQFKKLGDELDQLRTDIRACEDKEQLAEYESQIEAKVDKWVHHFQIIVSELSGVAPPPGPVYDS